MMFNAVIPNWHGGSAVAHIILFASLAINGSCGWHIVFLTEYPPSGEPIEHVPPGVLNARDASAHWRNFLGDELYERALLDAWGQICPVPLKEGAQDD